MIEIKDGWVMFSGADSPRFNPKRRGDEYRINNRGIWGEWSKYDDDLRNGHLAMETWDGVVHRRPLSTCTDAELVMLNYSTRDELNHFL